MGNWDRAFVVWFSALIVLICPHPLFPWLDFYLHRPAVLILVPVLLAALTSLIRSGSFLHALFQTQPRSRRTLAKNAIAASAVFLAIGTLILIQVNRSPQNAGKLEVNLTFGIALAFFTWRIWSAVMELRETHQGEDE